MLDVPGVAAIVLGWTGSAEGRGSAGMPGVSDREKDGELETPDARIAWLGGVGGIDGIDGIGRAAGVTGSAGVGGVGL